MGEHSGREGRGVTLPNSTPKEDVIAGYYSRAHVGNTQVESGNRLDSCCAYNGDGTFMKKAIFR